MDAAPEAPDAGAEPDDRVPTWRRRAMARTLAAARSRAEERMQALLDAAFALVDEKDSTDFTIQEVVERAKQSLRGFYEYFDGKDELLLAMFEEILGEAEADIRSAVAGEADPLERLHAFVIRLHEWCDPDDPPRPGEHFARRPISEFAMRLTGAPSERVASALAPISRLARELVDGAADAGAIRVRDRRADTTILLQTVMLTSFGNRLVEVPAARVGPEETWAFCRHGLRA